MEGRATLQPLLSSWVTTLKMRSPNTARAYEHAVSGFLAALPDGQVGGDEMAGYLESLDHLSPASRAHHISSVRAFLKFAQRQGAIATSLLDYLVRPRVKITSYNRYLDLSELRQLVAAAAEISTRHFAAVLVLSLTGIRVSEAANATWRDVYADPKGRIGLRVIGKGDKERAVLVTDELLAALTALREEAGLGTKLDARDQTPLILNTRGRGYSMRGVERLVAESVEKSGISKPASAHWLRHTHATLAADGGASVFTIQSQMGHSRLETSQRYIHMAKGLSDSTVDALPSLT